MYGKARSNAYQVRSGQVEQGKALRCTARFGSVWQGKARRLYSWHTGARHGMAGLGQVRQGDYDNWVR